MESNTKLKDFTEDTNSQEIILKDFTEDTNLQEIKSLALKPLHVLVTGAAGKVGYPLIYHIARGEVFGMDQPVILHLFDLPDKHKELQALSMELMDCALHNLAKIVLTSDAAVAFSDIDAAFFMAAVPLGDGMQPKDVLVSNAQIYKDHGNYLQKYAPSYVKVAVVANPCNTNAYICSLHATKIPRENITAMTRLDQNRAAIQIASHLGCSVRNINNIVVWGNHSCSQFPDAHMATVTMGDKRCQRVWDKIKDVDFLRNKLVDCVCGRAAATCAMRDGTPAMCAAKAAADHMHDWWMGTQPCRFVSMAVISDGSYGIAEDIFFSFPVQIKNGEWKIVHGLPIDQFTREKLLKNSQELLEERNEADMILKAINIKSDSLKRASKDTYIQLKAQNKASH